MILPPGYGYLQIHISFLNDPEIMLTGFGVKPTPSDDANCQSVVESTAHWTDPLKAVITSDVKFVGSTLRVGQDGGEPRVYEHAHAAVAGTQSSGALPPNSAWLIKKTTARGGKRHRGRMYLPGVPYTWLLTGGAVGTTQLASVQTAVDTLFDNVDGDTTMGGMWILHSTGISTTPDPTRVTGLVAADKIATQRRRLRP